MAEILEELCLTSRIAVSTLKKLGSNHTAKEVKQLLGADQPVAIKNCDFICYWDWSYSKLNIGIELRWNNASMQGIHPHSLESTNYAYIKECCRNRGDGV